MSALAESIAKTIDESQSISERLRWLEANQQALEAHNAELVERNTLLKEEVHWVVWYKVIEGGEKFSWPRHLDAESITLSAEQLEWLLDGYDVWKMKPHQHLHFSHVN